MNNYAYYLGGCLPIHAHNYVKVKADEDIYQGIKAGNFCYVLYHFLKLMLQPTFRH